MIEYPKMKEDVMQLKEDLISMLDNLNYDKLQDRDYEEIGKRFERFMKVLTKVSIKHT